MAITQSVSLPTLIDNLNRGECSLPEIRDYLHHSGAVVRANALQALIRFFGSDEDVISDLVEAAKNPINSVRLMGTVSVAHVAMECLARLRSESAARALEDLLAAWPEPDRSDLLWYLHSEGLKPGEDRPAATHPVA